MLQSKLKCAKNVTTRIIISLPHSNIPYKLSISLAYRECIY